MKATLISYSSLLLLVIFVSCSGKLNIIDEQFSSSQNESWDVPSSDDEGNAKINNGKLILKSTTNEALYFKRTCYDNFDGSLSFRWETLIVQSFKDSPSSYGGIVWGDYDSDYFNYFGYNANKEVVIIKENDQGDTYLFNEILEDFDPLEVTKLTVVREKTDGELSFWINDKEVHRTGFSEVFVGQHNPAKYTCFGFWTSSYLEADYLTLDLMPL